MHAAEAQWGSSETLSMQTSECPSREGIPTISLMVEFALLAEWKSPFMQAGPSKLGKPSLGNHRHPQAAGSTQLL